MPSLASPLTLPCGVELPNRIAKAAMAEQLGNVRTNAPTPALNQLYARWAAGGAGTVITGNVMVDRAALGETRNVAVSDETYMNELRAWATAATGNETIALVQINHPGRQASWILGRDTVAPSAVRLTSGGPMFLTPRALSEAEIIALIARFARTAGIVVRAGFSGVQIHGAHGYLVSQFLSPLTNLRQDAWGGDPERRRRFLVEIVRAVRAEIGAHTPLAVKLNSADFQRGGFSEEESMEVVEVLQAEGVDLLEISGGTYERAAMVGVLAEQAQSTQAREAYFLTYAEKVRARTTMPLMLTGGLRSPATMNDVLSRGAVDVIGIARPTAIDPDLPQRLLAGHTTPPPRSLRTRLPAINGLVETVWHTQQLALIGDGREPNPGRSPEAAIGKWIQTTALDVLARTRRTRNQP